MDTSSPYCPKCGALNPPEATTCFACDESLAAPASGSTANTSGSVSGPPLPGQLLRGRYRITRRIGEGGFGAVYQAEDRELGNRRVAIKEMSQYGLRPEELSEATEGFRREALLLAGLSHPSLPRIFEHFNEGGRWYLVMEFIEGETLEEGLKRVGGKLSVAKTLELSIKLCNVLEYLHTRQPPIIFRDLKPGNVMVTPTGSIFLIDFGIARLFKPGQSKDTIAFGSPGYAAPEQYGKAQTTPRSDVFSLGALLHHVLSGHDPSETPFRFAPLTGPALPGLWELIQRMVSLDEEKRPATVSAVRQELQRLEAAWEGGRQSSGRPTSVLAPAATGQFAAQTAGTAPRFAAPAPATQTAAPAAPPASSKPRPRRNRLGCLILLIIIFFFTGGPGFVQSAFKSWFGSPTPAPTMSTFPIVNTTGPDTPTPISTVSPGPVAPTFTPPPTSTPGPAAGTTSNHVYAVAWSPDGSKLAFGGMGGKVEILDTTNQKKIATYATNHRTITALAWSPNGKYLATGGTDPSVQVWDTGTGQPALSFTAHRRGISGLAWSPDNTIIASTSNNEAALTWNIQTNKLLLTFAYPASSLFPSSPWAGNAIAWSPDGAYIAAPSSTYSVQVWLSATGQKVYTYTSANFGIIVKSVAWSPDSTRIASASDDGTVQVWGALDGSNPVTYHGHTGPVESVVWSPDGTMLASAGGDASVQVWHVSGQPGFTYKKHSATVWALSWSVQGEIASASDDGTVLVSDAIDGHTLATYPYQL